MPRIIDTLKIISQILETDEVYAVGGPVRDFLLGKEPSDIDVASKLRPEEVIRRAEDKGVKVIPTGIDYGTVVLVINGENIEHTTFRREQYRDDRHPEVTYSDSIEEDLSRRDFTINAMAMNPGGEIIDPFGGVEDLKRGVIRAVGDPSERFYEDPLRIMRLARFAARENFTIDVESFFAARNYVDYLDPDGEERRVSPERIMSEFTKGLKQAKDPDEYVRLLDGLGVVDRVFKDTLSLTRGVPQQPKYHHKDVMSHSLDVLSNVRRIKPTYREEVGEAYREYKREYKKWEKSVVDIKEMLIESGQSPYAAAPPSFTEFLEHKGIRADSIDVLYTMLREDYGVEYTPDVNVELAALLHDVGKGLIWVEKKHELLTGKWRYACHDKVGYTAVVHELKRLRVSNKALFEVSALVLGHDVRTNQKDLYRVLKAVTKSGKNMDMVMKLAVLKKSDILAHNASLHSEWDGFAKTLIDNLATRPLNRKELGITFKEVRDIVTKYGKYDAKYVDVVAGEVLRRLEYDAWVRASNHPIDLRYRAVQLVKSNYRESKRPWEIKMKK